MFPSPIATRDEGKIYRIVTGPSGKLLGLMVDTIDGEVRLLQGQTLSRRGALILGASRTVRGCAIAPSDAVVAVATHDDVRVFDLEAGALRWKAPLLGDEPAIAFGPGGTKLAVGDGQGAAFYDAADGTRTGEVELRHEPRALAWDRAGLLALEPRALVLLDPATGAVKKHAELGDPRDEAFELVILDDARVALAGTSVSGVWLELRSRTDGRVITSLTLDDRRAEGLAFAGAVLFFATEGGVYRADPPYEQLVQWLPPLGGAHDPTRIAGIDGGHVAVVARDVRVFRTRS